MIFKLRRQTKAVSVVRKVDLLLKHALPTLVEALTVDIAVLDALLEAPNSQDRRQEYQKDSLARTLVAAANYHLKLKLGKTRLAQKDLTLLKYLNPTEPNPNSFAATCNRIFAEAETCDEVMLCVHWTELRNIYVYLLSRLA